MFKKIEKPAASEMRSVIRFWNARNMKPAGIHCQLCEVYREYAMSDSMVRRWARHFNEGCENVHDDLRSGQRFVANEDVLRAVEENIQENSRFTISSFSLHLPQISWLLLHETVTEKLGFQKLCSCWMLKMLMDEHKMKQQASALTFLTRYSEQGDDFLSCIVTGVTCNP
jgi:hypothetical protein